MNDHYDYTTPFTKKRKRLSSFDSSISCHDLFLYPLKTSEHLKHDISQSIGKNIGLQSFLFIATGDGRVDRPSTYFSKAKGRVIQYLISGQIFLKQQLFKGKKTGKMFIFFVYK